jgi:hypothetical protein
MKKYFKNTPRWLLIILITISILRIPTLFMPYSYGDEMIYLTLGEGIRQNLTLYKDIHDNKPPLIYILAAIAGNLPSFKLILAIFNLFTIFIFFKLTEVLFPKNKIIQKVSTIIFALLTNLPLLEGNIVNSEILMIGPIMLSFLIALTKKDNLKLLFLSGVIFSTAVLLKVPAIFDLPAIIFLWFLEMKKINLKEAGMVLKRIFFLGIGVLIPILLTFVWYFTKGALGDYLKAAFLQNVGYLSSWHPETKNLPFYVKNAALLLRATVVALSLTTIYIARKKLPKSFAFVSGWLVLSLFAATLSERPYPHYLVQAIPSISILLGILFTGQGVSQSLSIIPLTLAFFVPVYFKFWYYPSLPFYKNFIQFATRKENKEDYLKHFNQNLNRDYAIARFIAENTNKKDRIFVWGDDAKIYALSKRLPPVKYVADYHIKDFANKKNIADEIVSKNTRMIIILPESEPFFELYPYLKEMYIKINTNETNMGTTSVYVLPQ